MAPARARADRRYREGGSERALHVNPRRRRHAVVRPFGGAGGYEFADQLFRRACCGRSSVRMPTRRRMPTCRIVCWRAAARCRRIDWLLIGIFDWRSGLPYSVVDEHLDFVGPRNRLPFSDLRPDRARRRAPVQDLPASAVDRRPRRTMRSTRFCLPTSRPTSRRRPSALSTTPNTASSASRFGSSVERLTDRRTLA